MPNRRRRLSVAALAAFILAATSSTLAAQETNTVGPPQLKDFSLPGQRTTPPVQQPPVQQPRPEPGTVTPTRPAPVAATPSQTAPGAGTARPERPQPARPAPTAATPIRPVETGQAPSGAAPPATLPTATPPPASPSLSGPAIQPAAPATVAATAAPSATINWLWIGGAALIALLAFFGLRRFAAVRGEARRRARREERAAVRTAEAAAAAPSSPPPPAVRTGPRAQLELSFTAERAVATADETVVHYEMILRNLGTETARNIRIDVRMYNAGAKAAIAAFLKGPIHDESGSPHIVIEPGAELKLTSSIAMTKDEVRGIEVQGRSIFVPIVAINTAYDWRNGESAGSGRTSRSWLVGREPQAPSDKMGAFRLDLGPRIYRSIGQRPTELANVA